MAEGLREVAEQLAAGRVDLLGQQADVVDEATARSKAAVARSTSPGQRQRLGQPEGAEQEGALLARQPVDALRAR